MASRMAASLALAAGTPESVIAVGGSPALSRTAVSEYEQMGVHLGLRRDGGTLHNALQAQRLSSSLFDTPAVRRPDSPLRGPSLTGCTPSPRAPALAPLVTSTRWRWYSHCTVAYCTVLNGACGAAVGPEV
jgi:hypothetical protein